MTDAYHQQVLAQLQQARADRRSLEDEVALLRQRASQLAAVEAERDGAYRERAHLTAWLASIHPAVLAPAPDIDEDGWQILYLTASGQQLSWHIHPRDAELFTHVEQVAADDPRAQWDGHTTAEKYERIRVLTVGQPYGPVLTARYIPAGLPACPHCPRRVHSGYTCQEVADFAGALERSFLDAWNRGRPPHLGAAFIAAADGP